MNYHLPYTPVAYELLFREHAEAAQADLNGKEIEGFTLRVGWGASVPLPPTPHYVPPHMASEFRNMCQMATEGY